MGIFMRYGNIKGDSTQRGFEGKDGWMNLHDFGWSMQRNFAPDQVGRALNREAAQAQANEITISKDVDHASGEILQAATTDHKGQICEIVFLRTGNPGDAYLKFTLTDTLLKELTLNSGTPERPTEHLTLSFTKVEIECKTLDEANLLEDTMHIEYNIATGEGS
jgi:type VI secretion system secreted protein Hcp